MLIMGTVLALMETNGLCGSLLVMCWALLVRYYLADGTNRAIHIGIKSKTHYKEVRFGFI